MKNKAKYLVPAAVAAVAVSEPVPAAVDMFLKIDGVEGESQDDKHIGSIDVLAWSWNVSNSGTLHIGAGGGGGKALVRDLKVVKYTDKSTPTLLMKAFTGQHAAQATLTVRAAGDKPLEYLIIKMDEVLITNVATGGSEGEDRLTETITVNFAKICLKYTERQNDGSAGKAIETCWDVQANEPS